MAHRILVILGHPRAKSYGGALADKYAAAARKAGAKVRVLRLSDLEFDPAADVPYWNENWEEWDLELPLREAIEDIRWCDRMCWVYPLWWGVMPTLMKGFIDRVFSVPEFAAAYDNYGRPIGLLKPRKATLIVTMDAPVLWERIIMRDRGIGVMRHSVLRLCGVKTDRVVRIGGMFTSTDDDRARGLQKALRAGAIDGHR